MASVVRVQHGRVCGQCGPLGASVASVGPTWSTCGQCGPRQTWPTLQGTVWWRIIVETALSHATSRTGSTRAALSHNHQGVGPCTLHTPCAADSNVCSVCARCVLDVCSVCARCVLDVCSMCARCVPDVNERVLDVNERVLGVWQIIAIRLWKHVCAT